jgi:hypothetical protein
MLKHSKLRRVDVRFYSDVVQISAQELDALDVIPLV